MGAVLLGQLQVVGGHNDGAALGAQLPDEPHELDGVGPVLPVGGLVQDNDVAVLADQVLVLDHGRERFRGTVAELKERAAPDAPGDSVLERAYMSVLADDPDQGGHSHG